jgi:hypothetical protein
MRTLLFCLFTLISFVASSQTVNITGRCFYDANGNNVFDGTDSVIGNRIITASYAGGSNTANTNASGQYSMALTTRAYTFTMSGSIATNNYKSLNNISRTYTVAGSDVVNFAFKKRDSIESIQSYIQPQIWNTLNTGISPNGGSKTYSLKYAYDGFLPNMPATVTVRFNPRLTLLSTSIPPNITSSGLLQWNFSNVNRNTNFSRNFDSLILTFNFPSVGDTIGSFELAQKFVPGVTVSTPFYYYAPSYNERINHPLLTATGTSTGVKWLRHYAEDTIWNNQFTNCIDTTQDGNGFFVAGEGYNYGITGAFQNNIIVSKLNKDGLSIWEKNIPYLSNNVQFQNISSIKHTSDGGCILLGTGRDTTLPTNNLGNYGDVLVVRLNQTGDIVWQKKLNGSKGDEAGRSIVPLADGSFMISGTTNSKDGDFVNNNIDTSKGNIFLTKLAANGNVIFTKVYGGSNYEYGSIIVPLQNGSFLLLGTTESNDGDVTGNPHTHYTINTNPNPYPPNSSNGYYNDTLFSEEAWVLNVSANGNVLWNKCYGGSRYSYINAAAENGTGIMLSGFTDSKNGDLSYYPEAQVSLWLLQVSPSNGNIVWNKQYKLYKGYQDSNYIRPPDYAFDNYPTTGLHKTKDGNFITGSLASDKYGEIKTKHGLSDFTFIKISPSGNIVWQKPIGGTGGDYVNDMVLDKNDDIIFAGNTHSYNDDLYQNYIDIYGYQPQLMAVGKLGITNIIKGQVFIDNNNNHIKDAGEIYYSQGQILSVKATDTTIARIFDGKFLNNVDTGNYVTTYKPANNYFTVYPLTKNTAFPTFDMADSVNFALTPIPGIKDLEIELLPLSTPRPGFDVSYRIITNNAGPLIANNVVVGFKYDSRQTFSLASRPTTGMAVDSIWWGPFTINAFSKDTLYANFILDAPPLLVNGDTLTNKVIAYPLVGDNTPTNNQAILREGVRGSFDPNDKTEVHAGTLTTTQYANGEYLQYLIRFQNTGTDTAFFITVKDTLQQKLDLTTLEVISTSHPFTFKLEGQVATWDFKKILLPDSTSDEAGSHGFIVFRVKPKTGLIVGDEFTNKAAIYFDFNLPVITNEDKTILGNNNGLCPNGSVWFTSGLTGSTYQWQVNTGSGYVNLANGGIYSNVTSSVLRLSNVPTSLRGNKYRCLVNSTTYSPENKLRFEVTWTGAINTAWENPSNWDCGVLPDSKTDVVVPVGARYPLVGIAASCYSLQLSPSSTVSVKTGFNLLIAGVSGF